MEPASSHSLGNTENRRVGPLALRNSGAGWVWSWGRDRRAGGRALFSVFRTAILDAGIGFDSYIINSSHHRFLATIHHSTLVHFGLFGFFGAKFGLLLILCSGFFKNFDNMPQSIGWFHYISPMKYIYISHEVQISNFCDELNAIWVGALAQLT